MLLTVWVTPSISIHALREEGDESDSVKTGRQESFLSTPSVRRATSPITFIDDYMWISIHALREEGDCLLLRLQQVIIIFLSTPSVRRATIWKRWAKWTYTNFYPRPP